MTTAELVSAVQSKGISLVVNGDKLTVKGKDSALTPELLGELRQHKNEIMLLLAAMCYCEPPMPPADIDSLVCQHCQQACWCPTCAGCRWCAFEVRWKDNLEPRSCAKSVISAESAFQPNAITDHLLSRLQSGSHWLTAQHLAWLEGKQNAASDERFSIAVAAWGEMERSLRLVFGYEACIFGPGSRCPEDAPVICDFCVGAQGD
jgi:hypothetical protein